MKKIISLTIAVMIMLAAVMPNSIYKQVYASGTSNDIVSIARSEVGYLEKASNAYLYDKTANAGSANYTKYWAELNSGMQGQSWCVAFIVWCARKAGIGSDVIPTTYSTYDDSNSMKNWFSARGRYYLKSDTKPQTGDLIIFKYSDGNKHIGIVTGSDNSNVYTIEGNKSDEVCTQTYSLTESTIHGYCRPAYSSSGSAAQSAPNIISFSTDNSVYSVGNTVSFNVSANNVSSYHAEIHYNDVEIWSGDTSGNFSYKPTKVGKYSARLSASNASGTSYSGWIEFTVGTGERSVAGDFNGDGKDDYATFYDFGKGKVQWHVFLSVGSTFSEEIWWSSMSEGGYYAANCAGRIAAGDFNGDGKDDIAVMYEYGAHNTQIHVFISTGSSFKSWQTWYVDASSYPSSAVTDKFVAGDFNGDGKDDIAAMHEYDVHNTAIHVFISTGSSFKNWQSWYSDAAGYSSRRVIGRFVAGDFNGDGKDDIAAMYEYSTSNTAIHVFISTGSSFKNWRSWYSDKSSYAASMVSGRFVAGDFNGDGKDDIAAMYEYETYKQSIHVFLSTGSSFKTWIGWIDQTGFAAQCVTGRFAAGDFNGDGVDDIASMYDYDGDHIIFWMYISKKSKFTAICWNQINGYNAKRTTGVKAYQDSYTSQFSFTHKHTYTQHQVAATCTEQGYTLHTCTKGDNSYKDNYTSATGHKWGAWTVVKAPTTSQTGTEKRLCGVCNAGETRTVAALPTPTPTAKPTATPTAKPTATPTAKPTATPTAKPTAAPTAKPTATPTAKPTATPTVTPTPTPTATPTTTPTSAPGEKPASDTVIAAANISARPGDTVEIPVTISGNPGIAAFSISMSYDKTKLTPQSICIGDALNGSIISNIQQSGADLTALDTVTAVWSSESDNSKDGILYLVTFKIFDNAEDGEVLPISLSYNEGDISNQSFEDIAVSLEEGGITVDTGVLYGDIFTDGKINAKDLVKLKQYIALWDISLSDSELEAADVFRDGKINSKDVVKLQQYLAGWNVELGE